MDKRRTRKNNSAGTRFTALLAGICVLALIAGWLLDRGSLATLGAESSAALAALRISEVQNHNVLTLKDETGEVLPWIELENTGDEPLSLHGVCLTRDTKVNKTLVFPDITLEAGGFLLVYADGMTNALSAGRLHAPFRLPKSGSTALYLYDPSGNTIDSVLVPTMAADEAYAVNDAGVWTVTDRPTPGADSAAVIEDAGEQTGEVGFSEVMTANPGVFPDAEGQYHDYIELRNLTGHPVKLKNYGLTDNAAKPDKFRFPDMTLPADGYLTIHCSGGEDKTDLAHLHAAFKLSEGETLRLTQPDGTLIATLTLPAMRAGQVYSWTGTDGWTTSVPPTPNMENTAESTIALDNQSAARRRGNVYISEVMALPVDEKADWVELCNDTGMEVDLSGCGLSDQPGKPRRWQFPEGTRLNAGERLAVFLTGSGAAATGQLSAPFALTGAGGEAVCLCDRAGNMMDTLYLPAQYNGISYGRDEAGNCGYFETATPLKSNGSALLPPAPRAEYSLPGGLHHSGEAYSVTLTAPAGGRIYYTLDCSDPDMSKTPYTAPIEVTDTTILRTRVYMDGHLPSIMDTQSYLYDVNAAAEAPYVVSLVSDPTGLYSEETGIMVPGPNAEEKFPYGDYNRGANFWMEWEREAHVEVFTGVGETAISQECGIKLHGRNTRAYELKCFKVMAKPCYGASRFRYPIFHERPWDEYEAFILRYSGQDYKSAFMRDVVMTNQASNTSVMYMESEECICYLNGKYYSTMYIRENISPFSLARREGWTGQEASLDLVKSGLEEKQGSNASYAALKEYLKTHDNTTQETYEYIDKEVDIDNFIEFITMQIVYGPPDTVNVKRYRNPDADGKWRWVIYDLDRALRGERESTDGFELMAQGTNAQLFKAFMANPTLRDRFLDYLNQAMSTFLSSQSLADAANAQLARTKPLLGDYLQMMELTERKYRESFNNLLLNIRLRPALVLKHCAKYLHMTEDEIRARFPETLAAIKAYKQ